MAERGKCYIYGSMHIKMPREDILRELLSKVDYVLLEGFDKKNWRSVIRRKPSATLIVLGVFAYFAILHLTIRAMDKWYRLQGKPRFRGDMEYVRDYAVKLGKRAEVVDASLDELFSEQLVNLKLTLQKCRKVFAIFIIILSALLCTLPYTYIFYTYVNPIPYLFLLLMIVFIIVIILVIPITVCLAIFVGNINEFRDAKVVKRAKELIEMGYSVLIVRGKKHVPFLTSELQKHSIICEVYDT
jgi:magnesium-transporting ATPase (P-type)